MDRRQCRTIPSSGTSLSTIWSWIMFYQDDQSQQPPPVCIPICEGYLRFLDLHSDLIATPTLPLSVTLVLTQVDLGHLSDDIVYDTHLKLMRAFVANFVTVPVVKDKVVLRGQIHSYRPRLVMTSGLELPRCTLQWVACRTDEDTASAVCRRGKFWQGCIECEFCHNALSQRTCTCPQCHHAGVFNCICCSCFQFVSPLHLVCSHCPN